jgi:hypothetical protein
MSVRGALLAALRHLYENGWRLVVPNLVLAVAVLGALLAGSYSQTALLLLVAVGPLAAALMHCAVTVQQTDRLGLGDVLVGLRLHWRLGLALGGLGAATAILAVTAVSFYARLGVLAWPFAVVAFYLAAMYVVWQIHLWPLAVAGRRGLGDVLREAGIGLLRRPVATCGLALALLLVNAVAAIGILPVLTFTIAYSALAAAHFVLPPPPEEATT